MKLLGHGVVGIGTKAWTFPSLIRRVFGLGLAKSPECFEVMILDADCFQGSAQMLLAEVGKLP